MEDNTTGTETPESQSEPLVNPLIDEDEFDEFDEVEASSPEPEPEPEPMPEPEPEKPTIDPAITELQNQLTQQNQVMQQMMQRFEQMNNPQPEPEPGPAPLAIPNYEELMESIRYGEPDEAQAAMNQLLTTQVQHHVQQALETQYKEQQSAQQEQQRMQDKFYQDLSKVSDLGEINTEIEKVFRESPHLLHLEGAVNIAADIARGRVLSAKAAQNATSDWRQKALSDPEVRKQIIQEHTDSLRRGNKAPRVISSQPGGGSPASPVNRPKSIREAGDYFEAHISQG